ncbi:hypothetical protein HK098_004507 [Nowakowskiella sp. JEL0407]|nr:hypothetical protein HK098_004507 [Nowakowskiella sp. JEL0407]
MSHWLIDRISLTGGSELSSASVEENPSQLLQRDDLDDSLALVQSNIHDLVYLLELKSVPSLANSLSDSISLIEKISSIPPPLSLSDSFDNNLSSSLTSTSKKLHYLSLLSEISSLLDSCKSIFDLVSSDDKVILELIQKVLQVENKLLELKDVEESLIVSDIKNSVDFYTLSYLNVLEISLSNSLSITTPSSASSTSQKPHVSSAILKISSNSLSTFLDSLEYTLTPLDLLHQFKKKLGKLIGNVLALAEGDGCYDIIEKEDLLEVSWKIDHPKKILVDRISDVVRILNWIALRILSIPNRDNKTNDPSQKLHKKKILQLLGESVISIILNSIKCSEISSVSPDELDGENDGTERNESSYTITFQLDNHENGSPIPNSPTPIIITLQELLESHYGNTKSILNEINTYNIALVKQAGIKLLRSQIKQWDFESCTVVRIFNGLEKVGISDGTVKEKKYTVSKSMATFVKFIESYFVREVWAIGVSGDDHVGLKMRILGLIDILQMFRVLTPFCYLQKSKMVGSFGDGVLETLKVGPTAASAVGSQFSASVIVSSAASPLLSTASSKILGNLATAAAAATNSVSSSTAGTPVVKAKKKRPEKAVKSLDKYLGGDGKWVDYICDLYCLMDLLLEIVGMFRVLAGGNREAEQERVHFGVAEVLDIVTLLNLDVWKCIDTVLQSIQIKLETIFNSVLSFDTTTIEQTRKLTLTVERIVNEYKSDIETFDQIPVDFSTSISESLQIYILNKFIEEVMEIKDISSEECENIVKIMELLYSGIFPPSTSHPPKFPWDFIKPKASTNAELNTLSAEATVERIKSKFCKLAVMLSVSMMRIMELYRGRELSEFEAAELRWCLKAVFAESDAREGYLNELS